jgi:hypothetical protein
MSRWASNLEMRVRGREAVVGRLWLWAHSHKLQRLQEKLASFEMNFARGEAPKDRRRTFPAKGEAYSRVQDLLYAARSLGVPSMWAHGLQVMRRKSWNNGEVPYLPSTNHGIYWMLPFCRIKHIYCVAGLVQ